MSCSITRCWYPRHDEMENNMTTATTNSDETGKNEHTEKEITASQPLRPTLIKQEPRTYRIEEYGDYLFVHLIAGNLKLSVYGDGATIYMDAVEMFAEAGYTQYELLDSYMGPLIFFKYGTSEGDYEMAHYTTEQVIEYMDGSLAHILQSWQQGNYVQIEFRRDFIDMEVEIVGNALKEHNCQHPRELPLNHLVHQWYDGNPSDYTDAILTHHQERCNRGS